MSRAAPAVATISPRGDLSVNVGSWARHLRASNLSPNTVRTYLDSVGRLAAFLDDRGMPADLAAIRREHVESFIEHLLERWRPATAANRFVALKVFFAWAAEELRGTPGHRAGARLYRDRCPTLGDRQPPLDARRRDDQRPRPGYGDHPRDGQGQARARGLRRRQGREGSGPLCATQEPPRGRGRALDAPADEVLRPSSS